MRVSIGQLRHAWEYSGVMQTAITRGITVTHALLALHDGGIEEWREHLEALVRQARGTLCSPHHSDGEPDSRRYRLLVVTQHGGCPVVVVAHDPQIYWGESDWDLVRLVWSHTPPHSGVAAASAWGVSPMTCADGTMLASAAD